MKQNSTVYSTQYRMRSLSQVVAIVIMCIAIVIGARGRWDIHDTSLLWEHSAFITVMSEGLFRPSNPFCLGGVQYILFWPYLAIVTLFGSLKGLNPFDAILAFRLLAIACFASGFVWAIRGVTNSWFATAVSTLALFGGWLPLTGGGFSGYGLVSLSWFSALPQCFAFGIALWVVGFYARATEYIGVLDRYLAAYVLLYFVSLVDLHALFLASSGMLAIALHRARAFEAHPRGILTVILMCIPAFAIPLFWPTAPLLQPQALAAYTSELKALFPLANIASILPLLLISLLTIVFMQIRVGAALYWLLFSSLPLVVGWFFHLDLLLTSWPLVGVALSGAVGWVCSDLLVNKSGILGRLASFAAVILVSAGFGHNIILVETTSRPIDKCLSLYSEFPVLGREDIVIAPPEASRCIAAKGNKVQFIPEQHRIPETYVQRKADNLAFFSKALKQERRKKIAAVYGARYVLVDNSRLDKKTVSKLKALGDSVLETGNYSLVHLSKD